MKCRKLTLDMAVCELKTILGNCLVNLMKECHDCNKAKCRYIGESKNIKIYNV